MGKTFFGLFAIGLLLPSVLVAQTLSKPLPRDRYLVAVRPPTLAISQASGTEKPISASFSSTRNMSFDEITALATQNHPGVQRAKRQAEALRGAWIQAGLRVNPTLEFSSEEITDESDGIHGLTITQPIIPKYKRTARQAAVSKEYQAALQTYQIQCRKAINDVTLTAHHIAFAQRKCAILEDLTRIALETQRTSNELLQAQETERSAFLDIKIQAQRTQMAKQDADIAYKTACKELAVLLNLSEGELIVISDSIEELPAELDETVLLSEILACSPEVQKAYAEVDTARAKLKKEYTNAGLEYETSAGVAYNTVEKLSEFSVGIAIPLRLFDRNQGNIRQAQSEVAAANRNVERVQRRITQQFSVQWGEYQTARSRVITYKESILPEAEELQQLAFEAYRRGEYSSHEMLEAQRTFAELQLEYYDNLNALMKTQVFLQGALLSGGLEF